MRSIQHTITTLLLTASVVGGAALLSGTRTQLEQFRRDVGEIQHVVHGVASTWHEFSEVPRCDWAGVVALKKLWC